MHGEQQIIPSFFCCMCRFYLFYQLFSKHSCGLNFWNQFCGYKISWQISSKSIFGHRERVPWSCSELSTCSNSCPLLTKGILPGKGEGVCSCFENVLCVFCAWCSFWFFRYLRQMTEIAPVLCYWMPMKPIQTFLTVHRNFPAEMVMQYRLLHVIKIFKRCFVPSKGISVVINYACAGVIT